MRILLSAFIITVTMLSGFSVVLADDNWLLLTQQEYSVNRGFITDGSTITSITNPYTTGWSRTELYGINDVGVIVGSYYPKQIIVNDYSHTTWGSFIKNGTNYTAIPNLGAVVQTFAEDINNNGMVVGNAPIGFYDAVGSFVYDSNTNSSRIFNYPAPITNCPTCTPNVTYATGINDTGKIVGSYWDWSTMHGFIKDGSNYSLMDYSGSNRTYANDINNLDQIVGSTGSNAFIKDGINTTFFSYPGATSTQATAINDLGHIVGTYSDGTANHGFLKKGDTFITLDYPGAVGPHNGQYTGINGTYLNGINDTGMIVGSYSMSYNGLVTPSQPFFLEDVPLGQYLRFEYFWDRGINTGDYQQGYMFDVLALQGGSSQFIGQIDAYGMSDGWKTATLSVPKDLWDSNTQLCFVVNDYYPTTYPSLYLRNIATTPEPTTLLLFGLGLLGLAGVRREIRK